MGVVKYSENLLLNQAKSLICRGEDKMLNREGGEENGKSVYETEWAL